MIKNKFLNIMLICAVCFISTIPAYGMVVKKLKNGLTIVYIDNKKLKKTIIQTRFRVGSSSDPDTMSGLGYVMSRLICSNNNIPKNLKRHNLKVYRFFDRDFTVCTYVADRISTYDLIRFVGKRLTRPGFVAIEEDEAISSTIKSFPKPGNILETLYQNEFYGTKYEQPIEGTLHGLNTIKAAGIHYVISRYYSYYVPMLTVVAIEGHINKRIVLSDATKLYGRMPGHIVKPAIVETPAVNYAVPTIKITGEINSIHLAFASPNYASENSQALFVLSRLLELGKQDYDPDSVWDFRVHYNPFSAGPGLFVISHSRTGEYSKKFIDSVIEIIKTSPVSRKDLLKAKTEALKFIAKKTTISDVSESVSLTGSPNIFKIYANEVKKVTGRDIRRAARTWLVEHYETIGYTVKHKTE